MFVQIIRGQVSDPEEVHAAFDRWSEQLARHAPGWLGPTAGVTDDGQLVTLVRFETEEAARRNSDRPEQHQWWMETSKLFTGDVTFRDSSGVDVDVHGDPGEASIETFLRTRIRLGQRGRPNGIPGSVLIGVSRPL